MKIVASLQLKAKAILAAALALIICVLAIGAHLIFNEPVIDASVSYKEDIVVIIDAGHGGIDGGTQSADGTLEKEINLKIALKLNDFLLNMGIETVLIRDSDISVHDESAVTIREKKVSDIHNRLNVVESTENAVLVSIHQNYFTQPKYSGAQVFYSKNNPDSGVIADIIQRTIADCLQKDNSREIKQSGSEIYLLHNTTAPAVMVECGFLSNPDEAQRLKDEAYQQKIAFLIAISLYEYINTAEE